MSLEIWAVAGLVAGSLIEARLMLPAVLVGLVFWFCHRELDGWFFRRTPADWPVGLLALTGVGTMLVSKFPEVSRLQALRLFTGLALFYAVCNWTDRNSRLRWLVGGIVLAGVGLAVFGLLGVQWAPSKAILPQVLYEKIPLLVADAANPNVMAGTLLIFLPIGAALSIFDSGLFSTPMRTLALLATLLMAGIIALSQSRGAWLAGILELALLATLRWRRGGLILLAVLGVAGVGLILTRPEWLAETIVTSAAATGIAGRQQVWGRAIYMIQDFPFTGVGMGGFGETADLLYPFAALSVERTAHAHNLFLQIAVDLGIPGLVAWCAALAAVGLSALNLYRKKTFLLQAPWAKALGAGLLCSQVGLVANGILDAVTWGMVRPAPLVWLMWGAAMAAWNLTEAEETHQHNPALVSNMAFGLRGQG